MTLKLNDLKHLEKMAELEDLKPKMPMVVVDAVVKVNDISQANLTEKLLTLSSKLRSSGFENQADGLENEFFAYKKAEVEIETLYNTSNETGEDLVDYAHPDGDVEIAEAKDNNGDIETQTSQHKKIVDVINKSAIDNFEIEKKIIVNMLKNSLKVEAQIVDTLMHGATAIVGGPLGAIMEVPAMIKYLARQSNNFNTAANDVLEDLNNLRDNKIIVNSKNVSLLDKFKEELIEAIATLNRPPTSETSEIKKFIDIANAFKSKITDFNELLNGYMNIEKTESFLVKNHLLRSDFNDIKNSLNNLNKVINKIIELSEAYKSIIPNNNEADNQKNILKKLNEWKLKVTNSLKINQSAKNKGLTFLNEQISKIEKLPTNDVPEDLKKDNEDFNNGWMGKV